LPNYAVFDEKRYFTPGNRVLLLYVDGLPLTVNICEDIWDEDAEGIRHAHAEGALLVVNLSMSPYHVGKGGQREEMLSRRAQQTATHVCYVNGVGGQDELVFDGQSVVFDPEGRLLARAAQFEEELLLVDLNPSAAAFPVRQGGPPATGAGGRPGADRSGLMEIVRVSTDDATPTSGDEAAPAPGASAAAGPPVSCDGRVATCLGLEGEVYRALCLGVTDYVRKNRFQCVLLGMSGGIDSALTACVAADALGSDNVTAVSMPSRYSSAGTKSDARETAERLGIHFREIAIEDIYSSYLRSLEPAFAVGSQDVTEQNIQARIRGNLLMALSNKFGWLVLTTGNKSEMAVGYATLYGDMAGGFAVLKDVPKTLVYRLSAYRNSLGEGPGPIPASTIERAPSAELAEDQTDQDTLPPYEVLDRIVEAYVEHDESVEQIVARGIERREVERVVGMIDGNEYKRRQAAPGVRITPKAFGKDRRLPITNRYRG
jgi:NAD+ synthase (glutamine-hydrolysing)